jgi:hypothetical protein
MAARIAMPLLGRVLVSVGLTACALFTPPLQAQPDVRTVYRQIDLQLARRYQNDRTSKRSPRAENIRDEEVREIQIAAATLDKGFIISIGAVVAGCRCEEGPACTDEVSVALQKSDHIVGINFSKIENKWQLGVLQKWDLKYQALEARRWDRRVVAAADKGKQQQSYAEELATLLSEMPQCATNVTPVLPTAKEVRSANPQR